MGRSDMSLRPWHEELLTWRIIDLRIIELGILESIQVFVYANIMPLSSFPF
jgi:hypothetical protein